MKAKWIILVVFLGIVQELGAQSLIGLDKEEVRAIVAKEMKEFRIDKTIVRQQFNYLKYVNNIQTKTLIILFSEDDICTKTRLVCDYAEYDSVIEELDEKYKRTGDDSWEYKSRGRSYSISLEKLEWYFVIRETKKEK